MTTALRYGLSNIGQLLLFGLVLLVDSFLVGFNDGTLEDQSGVRILDGGLTSADTDKIALLVLEPHDRDIGLLDILEDGL